MAHFEINEKYLFSIDQPCSKYLQYKCTNNTCDVILAVYFNESIHNLTKVIVYGNLHNHPCANDRH